MWFIACKCPLNNNPNTIGDLMAMLIRVASCLIKSTDTIFLQFSWCLNLKIKQSIKSETMCINILICELWYIDIHRLMLDLFIGFNRHLKSIYSFHSKIYQSKGALKPNTFQYVKIRRNLKCSSFPVQNISCSIVPSVR